LPSNTTDYSQTPSTKSPANREPAESRRRRTERATTLDPEDERERLRQRELRRSRVDPSKTDILSGTALNDLLADVQRLQAKGYWGPPLILEDQVRRQLNVAAVTSNGHIGLLRDDGWRTWPAALNGPAFQRERLLINVLAPRILDRVKRGEVSVNELEELALALDRLHTRLTARIKDLSTSDYIRAKRFLNDWNDAVRVLRQPDAANYFNDAYAVQGATVAELALHMATHGLRFAPATANSEGAYETMHRLLAAYDLACHECMDGKP
jgi:hypothetical protein